MAPTTPPGYYCLLQTYGRMKFADPTVALRVHKNTPDEVWRLGIESSKICGGIPQIQNDEMIIKSLMDAGLSVGGRMQLQHSRLCRTGRHRMRVACLRRNRPRIHLEHD